MPYRADSRLADFVQSLPKTETHLPLEGACPFALVPAHVKRAHLDTLAAMIAAEALAT